MSRFFALVTIVMCGFAAPLAAQEAASPLTLTVERIMQEPETWIGAWPSNPRWGEDGQALYFDWNPTGQFDADSLYRVSRDGGVPEKVPPRERRQHRPFFDGWHHGEHIYTDDFERKVYAQDGDLFVYDRSADTVRRLTQTLAAETAPRFSPDGQRVVFVRDGNLMTRDLQTGLEAQVTDLRPGKDPEAGEAPSAQDAFLEAQQDSLFAFIRNERREREAREAAEEEDARASGRPPAYYYGRGDLGQLRLDPSERYATFSVTRESDAQPTSVQAAVTESGYTEERTARPKVGAPGDTFVLYVQDLARDTTYAVDLHGLPGAADLPTALEEAEADSAARRLLYAFGPYWNADGSHAVLDVRARDNKDRWIARLDPATAVLTLLDRQTDEAWIAGPGISWWGGESTVGWMPDGRRFFFQSEANGYSHLYTVNVETGRVQPVTQGAFEVFDVGLSQDGRTWTFQSSEASPYERHLYRLPTAGGRAQRLTDGAGRYDGALSPDGDRLGLLFSQTTQPPEIYLQDVPPLTGGAPLPEPQRVTYSTTEAWSAYPWRSGDLVTIPASDGVEVPAQVFVPEAPNGAAVLFVHGAGYLQNVHRWWSSYFREYMFHNLLADLGYTVFNVDYRASAGYGRDWRTAVHRHMGGRDLQDYVDASRYASDRFGIDPERVFIYGGSYGGFITLMALFTEAEHFGGGAALRSVTDWAHYNHAYTANILGTPAEDSLAFARSSPIYYAEGLEDPLLMCHGLVDTNVQPQDIFRLTQRLIELGKEDWELALYPVEGHGFTEPESWTDEYRRILELVERAVGPEREAATTRRGPERQPPPDPKKTRRF